MKKVFELLYEAGQNFTDAKAPMHAAALAYYTVFSLAPLLVFAVAIAGVFVGRAVASGELNEFLQTAFGPQVADYLNQIAQTVSNRSSNATFTIISIGVLFVGASGVFNQLKVSLDAIFGVTPDPDGLRSGIINTLRRRGLAIAMVLVAGAALLLSILLELIVSQIGQFLETWIPGLTTMQPYLRWIITPLIGFLSFVIMFKLLPEASTGWREVLVGASLTAVLFTIGVAAIGFFLRQSGTTSIYGAAGSLIVVLLWVYYSSWILLYGASFTRVYGEHLAASNPQGAPNSAEP